MPTGKTLPHNERLLISRGALEPSLGIGNRARRALGLRRPASPTTIEIAGRRTVRVSLDLALGDKFEGRKTPGANPRVVGYGLTSVKICPRQESNLRTRFRKPLLYPLSYGACAA